MTSSAVPVQHKISELCMQTDGQRKTSESVLEDTEANSSVEVQKSVAGLPFVESQQAKSVELLSYEHEQLQNKNPPTNQSKPPLFPTPPQLPRNRIAFTIQPTVRAVRSTLKLQRNYIETTLPAVNDPESAICEILKQELDRERIKMIDELKQHVSMVRRNYSLSKMEGLNGDISNRCGSSLNGTKSRVTCTEQDHKRRLYMKRKKAIAREKKRKKLEEEKQKEALLARLSPRHTCEVHFCACQRSRSPHGSNNFHHCETAKAIPNSRTVHCREHSPGVLDQCSSSSCCREKVSRCASLSTNHAPPAKESKTVSRKGTCRNEPTKHMSKGCHREFPEGKPKPLAVSKATDSSKHLEKQSSSAKELHASKQAKRAPECFVSQGSPGSSAKRPVISAPSGRKSQSHGSCALSQAAEKQGSRAKEPQRSLGSGSLSDIHATQGRYSAAAASADVAKKASGNTERVAAEPSSKKKKQIGKNKKPKTGPSDGHRGALSPHDLNSGVNQSSSVPATEVESSDVEMMDVSADLQSLDALKDPFSGNDDPNSIYVVLDTNVLMHDLKFVDELKDIPLQGCGSLHVVIPWKVIQELDGIKSRSDKNRYRAIEAVRYIYNKLVAKHPRFHGQTAEMAASCKKSYDQCNDDVILGCCLQLAEKIQKDRIILLSNDVNLCNKAIISSITGHTVSTLQDNLKSQIENLHRNLLTSTQVNEVNAGNIKGEQDADLKKGADVTFREAKMLLKFALEPFLKKEMKQAFGDLSGRFLPSSPATLCDILDCYKRYWVSVFGLKLGPDVCKSIESLCKTFSLSKGYSCDVDSVLKTLKEAQTVCKAILPFSSSIEPYLKRISVLIDQYTLLTGKEGEEKHHLESQPKPDYRKENNEIVLAVFNHLWALINQLCGMTLSFAGIQHEFVYNQPEEMPSMVEFQLLLSNLYPSVHSLRKIMTKLQNSSSTDKGEEVDKDFRTFYNYLLHFVPSLQIQASPPPTDNFTVDRLKQFFMDPENRELLKNGVTQLELFYTKLNECVQHPIWKQNL